MDEVDGTGQPGSAGASDTSREPTGDGAAGEAGDVEESRRARMRSSLQRLGLAIVAVTVIGLMSGYLFATSSPERAAGARISAFVRIEPAATPSDEIDTWDPAAPTSGAARGEAGCGTRDRPLPTDDQVAALAAGRVLVQYRPDDLDAGDLDRLRKVARTHDDDTVLAPNPDLATPVVATAWSRRMELRSPEPDLLDSFATAYAGGGPTPAPCEAA